MNELDVLCGWLSPEQKVMLAAALAKGIDMDWAALLQLALKMLESLIQKEIHAAKNGFDGPFTAGVKVYNRCCEEMKQ